MKPDADPRARRQGRLHADRLERELVALVMERLRPALQAAFNELQDQVESIVGVAVGRELAQGTRMRRLGETKRCRVCGLEGSRNFAGLKPGHSRQEHQGWKLRQAASRRAREVAAEGDPLRVAG
jgi:hypothetical protein